MRRQCNIIEQLERKIEFRSEIPDGEYSREGLNALELRNEKKNDTIAHDSQIC